MERSLSKLLKYATQRREPFYKIAKKYIKKESVVLDIGAGNGSFAEYLSLKNMFLIDGNINTVKKYKLKYPNYYHCKLPELPFSDNQFDVIHCSHIIEHLYPEELYDLLKNCNRCIKDGGYLIISAPLMWEHFWDDLSHIRPYSPVILKKYLCKSFNLNPARETISNKYSVIEEQYRYRATKLGENIFLTRSSVLNIVLNRFFKIINYLGIKKLEKTGYTIVLMKNTH